jgi:NADH dehydrogenase FAD-containing subunit
VFAAGDCAVIWNPEDANPRPLPSTEQVAYQQGAAISHNVKAQLQSKPHLQPAHVALRGTLMRLGLGIGVANLFDRYEIIGKTGQLIRQAAYLELLPTPVYNIHATAE